MHVLDPGQDDGHGNAHRYDQRGRLDEAGNGERRHCRARGPAVLAHTAVAVALTVSVAVPPPPPPLHKTKPSNHFLVSGIHGHPNGNVTFFLRVPGPGTINVLETAWDDNFATAATALLQPAPNRFAFSRKHVKLSRGRGIQRSPSSCTPRACA